MHFSRLQESLSLEQRDHQQHQQQHQQRQRRLILLALFALFALLSILVLLLQSLKGPEDSQVGSSRLSLELRLNQTLARIGSLNESYTKKTRDVLMTIAKLDKGISSMRKQVSEDQSNAFNELKHNVDGRMGELDTKIDDLDKALRKKIRSMSSKHSDSLEEHVAHLEHLYNRTLQVDSNAQRRMDAIEDRVDEAQIRAEEARQTLLSGSQRVEEEARQTQTEVEQLELETQMLTQDLRTLEMALDEFGNNNDTEVLKHTLASLNLTWHAWIRDYEEEATSNEVNASASSPEFDHDLPCEQRTFKLDLSNANCSASSTYSPTTDCHKAFDGLVFEGEQRSFWASNQGGVGEWIEVTFPRALMVTRVRLLQRWYKGEANKSVSLRFSDHSLRDFHLWNAGDALWNELSVQKPFKVSTSLRVTIKSVYGQINNGFKEIEVIGCDP